jgi:hypothetical protein
MSDIKHQSVEELRGTVDGCQRIRSAHENSWKQKEAEIERLQEEIAEHRRIYHNVGQKEEWARLYLAQKEIEGASI